MKVTIRTLQQRSFEVDAEPQHTILNLKEKVGNVQGEPPENLKLFYAGKTLTDDQKSVGSLNLNEGSYLVVMVTKSQASGSSRPGFSRPEFTAPTPSFNPMQSTSFGTGSAPFGAGSSAFGGSSMPFGGSSSPFGGSSRPFGGSSTSFGNSSSPFGDSSGGFSRPFGGSLDPFGGSSRPFGGSTSFNAPSQNSAPKPSSTSESSAFNSNAWMSGTSMFGGSDSSLENSVKNLVDMGFERDQVLKALKASFGNTERAVEYLTTGIPDDDDDSGSSSFRPFGASAMPNFSSFMRPRPTEMVGHIEEVDPNEPEEPTKAADPEPEPEQEPAPEPEPASVIPVAPSVEVPEPSKPIPASTVSAPVPEALPAHAPDAAPAPEVASVPEVTPPPEVAPVSEPAPKPATETTTVPVTETATEPAPEPAAEPTPAPDSAPVSAPESTPAPISTPNDTPSTPSSWKGKGVSPTPPSPTLPSMPDLPSFPDFSSMASGPTPFASSSSSMGSPFASSSSPMPPRPDFSKLAGLGAFGNSFGGGDVTLESLRDDPMIKQIRELAGENSDLIGPLIEQLVQSKPGVMKLIASNPEGFAWLLASGGSSPGVKAETHSISVTGEEKAALDRLESMGFPRAAVIQAYFAFEKDEERAANYLIENHADED